MAFLKKEGVNLLSLVFVSGSNNTIVIRSDDVLNFPLILSRIHHHLHHE
jgi:hypothetical protein